MPSGQALTDSAVNPDSAEAWDSEEQNLATSVATRDSQPPERHNSFVNFEAPRSKRTARRASCDHALFHLFTASISK